MSAPSTWSPGDVIGGRYRLVSRLGAGGMGAVWRAHHASLGSDVAIKLLRAKVEADPNLLARFEIEARAAAAIRGPHVVQILDHGIDERAPYIVMELLHGESLAQRLAKTSVLTPEHTARIIAQVARALAKAHEIGVIHRDLKPENIFLVDDGDQEITKLLDFGIAKLTEPALVAAAAAPATRSDAILGTPLYMSPEQLRGRTVDHRADLWSLAVIVYQCLCGAAPFQGNTLADLMLTILNDPIPVPSRGHDVPAGFDAWFRKGVSRDPNERFGSARELSDALTAVAEGRDPPGHGAASEPPASHAAQPGEPSFAAGRGAETDTLPAFDNDAPEPRSVGSVAPPRQSRVLLVTIAVVCALGALLWTVTRDDGKASATASGAAQPPQQPPSAEPPAPASATPSASSGETSATSASSITSAAATSSPAPPARTSGKPPSASAAPATSRSGNVPPNELGF